METITSIFVDLITDPITKYVVIPIKNHFSYAFTCDNKVQKLHLEVQQLQNKRDRLQKSVDEATRNGEQIHKNVTEWLSSVKTDMEDAEKLVREKEEAKNKCCSGFCPNMKSRYHIGKKAHKKALAINEQLQNAQRLNPISFHPPSQPIVEPSMYYREALPSRVRILNHIMDALKDPNLNMIGVHGMGGVGKTTLAKEVLRQAVEQKLFETVVLVAVSETYELRRIQGEIADALDLKLQAEQVPGRASRLHQRLNTTKVLIILDDVWQKLDLYAVGIPSGDASKGCKILVTSRRKEVLSSEMCTQKEFSLDVLEEEETWRLFEMNVSMANNLEFLALATEVAKKCAGLPLLIKKVATDLRNKDVYVWKDMLTQLSISKNTEIYEKVHKVMESSYEKLVDEEAKSLFLLCALFGSSNIQIHDLLIYCMGLGLFKHIDSIEGSRNRLLTLIDKLKNENLLLDDAKPGFVKIHDVVRDIATAIASREHHVFVGKGQIRSTDLERKYCRRISLPYCDIHALPEVLQCPEAEVFSLFVQHASLIIPNSFFERATKLKVLHFTDVSFVSGLPLSLGFLTGLQTLSLHGCNLNNVAMVAELKQLEILSFASSNIAELPREIKALTRLKLLDLTGCDGLQVIPSNVLSNLSLLEELYMLDSFQGWDVAGNASLVELKNLSHLTTLEIIVQDDELLPEDWFFNGIQNYKIIIGYWDRLDTKEASRMLILELKTSIGLMDRIKEFLEGTEVLYLGEVNGIENLLYDSNMEKINSFPRLRFLHIKRCGSLRELLPFSSEKCLPHLQQLEVEYCSNMEAIVGEGNGDEVMEFTQLTSLMLTSLPHIKGFCRTSETVSFPNLTSLEVYDCKSLKYVFTTSMVKSLKQLKKLVISHCDLMEEIILVSKFEGIDEDNIDAIVFPELDFLQLSSLESLKRFGCGHPVEFPKLRELKIESCSEMNNFVSKYSKRSTNNESSDEYLFNEMLIFPNLEIIEVGIMRNLMYLWHQQFADNDSFSKLKSFRIFSCSKLSVVFPSDAYRRFRRLESLHVSYCPDLKHVFPEAIACDLLHLEHLEIQDCGVEMIIAEAKNEGSEGTSTRTFEWPKLKSLIVCDCDKLIKFSSNVTKAKHNIQTPDSLYFIEKIIPNVKVLQFNHHSLRAIQSEDHGFADESLWKLEMVTLVDLEEESIPFLYNFLRRIYSLENLTFRNGALEDIFSLHDERAAGDQEQRYHLRLKHLNLDGVNKLKHIVKKDSHLNPIFRCIQTLTVGDCYDLINIAPSSSTASFQNLTTLVMYGCRKMRSLVATSTSKTMIQLMKLQVSECTVMEEIVANEDGDFIEEHDDDDVITFNKLKHLELTCLYGLNSFCSGNYMFSFPLLEQVSIARCYQMKIFCGGVLSTPKLQGMQYEYETLWEGNLNATIARHVQENGSVDISEDGGDDSPEM